MTSIQPPNGEPRADGSAPPPSPTNYVSGIADGNLATPMRLRDYLNGVGVVFRLARRNRKKEQQEAEAEKERRRIHIPVRKLALAIAPAVVAYLGYTAYGFFSGDPLPTEINGTWSTNDGRYAGRNFWINPSSVAFQNGKKSTDFSVHPIKKVKARQVADTLFLAIDYEQEGHAITLSIAYRDIPQPEIRLVNQPTVRWMRTGEAPVISQ